MARFAGLLDLGTIAQSTHIYTSLSAGLFADYRPQPVNMTDTGNANPVQFYNKIVGSNWGSYDAMALIDATGAVICYWELPNIGSLLNAGQILFVPAGAINVMIDAGVSAAAATAIGGAYVGLTGVGVPGVMYAGAGYNTDIFR